jgi:SAM-dependent methyltransferase
MRVFWRSASHPARSWPARIPPLDVDPPNEDGEGFATAERFVPGRASPRIREDHLERYAFASRFARGCRVLDIACGTGYGTKMLHDAGAESVCGVDISPNAIAHAREHFGAPSAQFMEGDICEFGNENGADLICCFETIEHVLDPVAALRNLRRLLDPAGILVISSPNRPVHAPRLRSMHDQPSNLFHVCEFTPPELRDLLTDTGFSVDHPTWGQRFSPRMPRQVRRLYGRLVRPAVRTSAVVRRRRFWESPRYFLLVAG